MKGVCYEQKIISFITSLAMIISLAVFLPSEITTSMVASAAYENTWSNTGNQREDIVKVAETQIGYHEGANNDTKYNRWNGKIDNYPVGGYGYPWCQLWTKMAQ